MSVVNATGRRQSVYESRSDLVEVETMRYGLSVGMSFEVVRETLKTLNVARTRGAIASTGQV